MKYAISPLDGRYAKRLHGLSDYFSEFALMRARCRINCSMCLHENTKLFPPLTSDEKVELQRPWISFRAGL